MHPHLLRALPVNLQQNVFARSQCRDNSIFRSAVIIAMNLGGFDEAARIAFRQKIVHRGEMVGHAIDFTLTRGARVVCETDSRMLSSLLSNSLTSDDLPAPLGATTTNKLPMWALERGLFIQFLLCLGFYLFGLFQILRFRSRICSMMSLSSS